MACEVNALDSAVISAAIPLPDDVIWVTKQDGTTVFIKYSTFLAGSVPDDLEYVVGVTPGGPAAAAFTWVLPAVAGKRFRLIREGSGRQFRVGGTTQQLYSFNEDDDTITVNVQFDLNERVAIEFY